MGKTIIGIEELTPKQLRAVEALLAEPTASAAAKACKVAESTIYRWLGEPAFNEALRQARTRLLDTTLTRLQSASGAAVDTLRDILRDKLAPAAVKVSAARAILEFAIKGKEILETEERLAAIEQALKLREDGKLRAVQ